MPVLDGWGIIDRMDGAFLVVVIGVSLLAIVVAAIALATSGGAYDEIGRGRFSLEEPRPPGTDAEAIAEVRQMIEARNARGIARGEPPLDVEAEVSKRLRDL
jgi:hypothetical protein